MSYAGLGQVQSNLAALADCLAVGGSWDGNTCHMPVPELGPPSVMSQALQCGYGGGIWDAPTNSCLQPIQSYIRKCERAGGRLDASTSWDCRLPSGNNMPRPAGVSLMAVEQAAKAQKAGGGKWECLAQQGAWDGSKCLLPQGTPATVVSGLTQQGTPVQIVDRATWQAKRAKINPLVLAAVGAVALLGGAWWWSSQS